MIGNFTRKLWFHLKLTLYVAKISFCFLILILSLFGCTSQVQRDEESKVLKIDFEGNHFISDGELRGVLPVKEGDKYIEPFLKESPRRIVSYYRSRGFFDMRVLKREGEFQDDKNGFIIKYHLFEGARSTIDSVEVIGNEIFREEVVKRTLSVEKGSHYDEANIDAGKYILSNNYAEKGFPDATITTERSFLGGQRNKNSVYLKVQIKEGNKFFVRDINIKGLEEVQKKVVRRELRISIGDVYRPSKIHLSQSNLYRTELFSDVNVHEEKVCSDSVDITFILKEEKSRFFQVGLGYESPRKAIIDFRWGDLNFFGNLQRLTVDLSFKGEPDFSRNTGDLHFTDWEQNYRVTYKESYLLGTDCNLIASPSLRRREFQSDFALEFILEREIGPFAVVSIPYEYRRASIQEDTLSITNKISARFLFDRRNNLLNPSKGVRLLFQYDYAGRILGGDNHFDRLNFDFAFYYSLPLGLIIAQRSRAIFTFPKREAEDISADVRLEMGGYGSLRGYGEASIGFPDSRPDRRSGLDELLFNLELRMPVYGKWYATIFADFGSLWMDLSDISIGDFNTGLGFGIGYNSPIGVIRLDYARAMRETDSESGGKIYFNFGHPF